MSSITYDEFKTAVTGAVTRYLQILSDHIARWNLRSAPGYIYLFPSTLVFTQTDTHYAFELLGSRRQNGPLLVKDNNKISSFNRLVGSFEPDDRTLYIFGPSTAEQTNIHERFVELTLTSQFDMEELERRFPGFSALSPKAQIRSLLPSDSFMLIDVSSIRTVAINRCFLTSRLGRVTRPRYINFLFGDSKQVDWQEFTEDLGRYMNIPSNLLMGVSPTVIGHAELLQLSAEFASLYFQNVEETTLTQFLRCHEEMIKRAFDADKVFFEEDLVWMEGNPDLDEVSIRPDVILRKQDGSWMIMDFKLPLLDKAKITAGKRARRKFIYTVNDGISQLFNYADYFSFSTNRTTAALTLGEEISSPQLMLIVGTTENVNMTEVNEARRSYKAVEIIDYDTLVRLFLDGRQLDVSPLVSSRGNELKSNRLWSWVFSPAACALATGPSKSIGQASFRAAAL